MAKQFKHQKKGKAYIKKRQARTKRNAAKGIHIYGTNKTVKKVPDPFKLTGYGGKLLTKKELADLLRV